MTYVAALDANCNPLASTCLPSFSITMLGRTARQAARVAHGPPKRAVSAPRLTRSYATPAPASGPHERSSGMNSTVAGLGVFGATLLLGFVMGALPDHSKRETALQKLGKCL